MCTVGVIVNPIAGTDIRRLVTGASHTSDSAKVDIVRRAVVAAVESGAERVLVVPDPHQLAQRAIAGARVPAQVLDVPVSGSRRDTIAAARAMRNSGADVLIVLGGDGTCRDVAIGWPDAVLIAISTGTNNVYPSPLDATSAGSAAGFIAAGSVEARDVTRRSKRLSVVIADGDLLTEDLALVDVAVVDTTFVGSRAVLDPTSVMVVVAAIATPASTGLSSIAGRIHPVDRWQPGGVMIRLGHGGRQVRAPMSPGSFSTFDIVDVRPLADGEVVPIDCHGIIAFDGERDRRLGNEATATARVDMSGPQLIDVEATLLAAAAKDLFSVAPLALDLGGTQWQLNS